MTDQEKFELAQKFIRWDKDSEATSQEEMEMSDYWHTISMTLRTNLPNRNEIKGYLHGLLRAFCAGYMLAKQEGK